MDIETLALKGGPLSADEIRRVKALSRLQGAMSDMLVARFQENIRAFSAHLPEIAAQFKHYRPTQNLEFFCTENGIPNLMLPDRGGDIFYKTDNPQDFCDAQAQRAIHEHIFTGTRYKKEWDPYGQIHFRYLEEAVAKENEASCNEELISAEELKSIPNAVIVGIGLGYILQSLYSRAEIINLVVVEPDLDMFYASLHCFEWAPFLDFLKENHFGINLLLGQTPEQLSLDLGAYYEHHGRFLSAQCLCLVHHAGKEIRKVVDTLLNDYYRLHAAMGFFDDHLFGTSHALYAATHHKHFVRADVSLPEEYRQVPLFIIGNGPSLDEDIPYLRKHQDEAVIIACGTALDTLYHAGIKPDFYAATERTPEICETIDAIPDREFIRSLTLIAGDVIHPYTQDLFEHTAIFGKPDEPFYWRMFARHPKGRLIRPVNVMNPIVGNLGVSAGLALGFRNVVLFGLDNGKNIKADRMHSKYSVTYGENGLSDTSGNYNTQNGPLLPGNFGGEVAANYIFRLANRHMELVIRLMKKNDAQLQIINCSGGALIEGADPVHSKDLKLKSGNTDKDLITHFIREHMTFDLNLNAEQAEALCNKDEFKRACECIYVPLQQRPKSRTEFVKAMEKCSENLWLLYSSPLTRPLSCDLEGSTQALFITALSALYHIKDEEKAVAAAWDVIKCLKNFIDDAKRLFDFLPHYIMGEHHRFLNGKKGFDHEDSKAPEAHMRGRLFKQPVNDPVKKFVKRLR